MRPDCVKGISLAQFATHFTYTSRIPKKVDFEEDGDGDSAVVPEIEVTSKDQAARTLEVRRAIEERMEQRKFKDDLDYLDDEI